MLITALQLAKIRGVTQQTITNWCRAGFLDNDAEYINGRWIIHWSDFLGASLPVSNIGRPAGSRNKKPYPKGVRRRTAIKAPTVADNEV